MFAQLSCRHSEALHVAGDSRPPARAVSPLRFIFKHEISFVFRGTIIWWTQLTSCASQATFSVPWSAHRTWSNLHSSQRASSDAHSFFRRDDVESQVEQDKSAAVPESLKADHVDESPAAGPPQIPNSQWYTGLAIYAVTNIGFYKLFEFCSGEVSLVMNLMAMVVYYAGALLLRLVLRRLVGLGKPFPQFWWEGIPRRASDDEAGS
jgi:hypothetical protein